MKTWMMSVRVCAIFAAVVLVCIAGHTQAATILVSGNSMSEFDPELTGAIAGLGHTAVFVAPFDFEDRSLTGFDAVWLDGFSKYDWPHNVGVDLSAKLLDFMNAGGNVFVQNPGVGSEPLSAYPLGTLLTLIYTCSSIPPGENNIDIVDATSPVNAGLTKAGLSNWMPSACGYFDNNIGTFSGLTDTGTSGQWVTIIADVGAGSLVYTQQLVSQYLSGSLISAANPGPSSEAARFLDNVITLTQVPEPSTMTLLLLGLGLIGFISLIKKAARQATGVRETGAGVE